MFKVIVWATDGSESASNAMRLAQGLAQTTGAKLCAVHVDEFGHGRAGEYHTHADEKDIREGLARTVEDLRQHGVDAMLEMPKAPEGEAAEAIADAAREAGADLIVAGTRGHRPLAGLVVGSVAQRLLHVAPCPILIVPPSQHTANEA